MAKLGLNVDHVATVRQARGGVEPDPVAAAGLSNSLSPTRVGEGARGDILRSRPWPHGWRASRVAP